MSETDPGQDIPDPPADDQPETEPVGEPEETDNAPRPEDGDQDVDQSPEPAG